MEIKFLGQGFKYNNNLVGELINDSLNDVRFNNFNCLVAFTTEGGINRLIESYNNFTNRSDTNSLIILGIDQQGTPEKALRSILEIESEVYIYHNLNNSVIFHPKIYIFRGDYNRIIIGSSNLTATGLFQNIESSVSIEFDNHDEKGESLLGEIFTFYNSLFNKTDPNMCKLSSDLINKLVSSKKIPISFAESIIHNKILNQAKSDQKDVKVLEEFFSDKSSLKAPKRTSLTGESYTVLSESERSNLINKSLDSFNSQESSFPVDTTSLSTDSNKNAQNDANQNKIIWFQSGELTGGSSNILDLSSKGRASTKGGLHLLNPTMKNNHKFTIRHLGIDFHDNNIKYPLTSKGKSNGSWRAQLFGKSVSGKRFTDFTRKGELKNKILIFKEISPDHYEIEVQPESNLKSIELASSFFDKSPSKKGRAYGILRR